MMRKYSLAFKASGEQVFIPLQCEVLIGKVSLNYKPIVDDAISKWCNENSRNAQNTSIFDIILYNEDNQMVFSQENWNTILSINIVDFIEETNTDLAKK